MNGKSYTMKIMHNMVDIFMPVWLMERTINCLSLNNFSHFHLLVFWCSLYDFILHIGVNLFFSSMHMIQAWRSEFYDLLLLFTLGQRYYYNTKTNMTQWERPNSSHQFPVQHPHNISSGHEAVRVSSHEPDYTKKCMGCGGWGIGVVQPWGFCNHCTR